MGLHSLSISKMSKNQQPQISDEGMRSFLNQIENELIASEVYQSAIKKLKPLLGPETEIAQTAIKAVVHEAVQITFKQIANHVVPAATAEAKSEDSSSLTATGDLPNNNTDTLQNTMPERLQRPIGVTIPISKKRSQAKKKAAQAEKQKREDQFRKVGRQLREAREAQSLTVRQLNNQTLVPIHQIEAIEAGEAYQPEEDIYVRGFVRRLGNALGLNGVNLAASLPEPEGTAVVPSWDSSPVGSGMEIKLAHLYFGYTAMVAGSLGGLAWMGHQGAPSISAEPEIPASSEESISSVSRYSDNSEATPENNVAPPEIEIQEEW